MVFAELGPPAFALKAECSCPQDYGSRFLLFNAFLVAQGSSRELPGIERHVANAQRAELLAARRRAGQLCGPFSPPGMKGAKRLKEQLAGGTRPARHHRERVEAAQPSRRQHR